MNECDIKVGDYVETSEGDIGYVSGLGTDVFCWYDAPYKPRSNIQSTHMNDLKNYKDIPNKFKRIGANDFSKKKNKFEPIDNLDICYATGNELIHKLNKLIDHSNAIQERLNEGQ